MRYCSFYNLDIEKKTDQGVDGEYANHYKEQKCVVQQKKIVGLFSYCWVREGCNGKPEVTSWRSIGDVVEICWKCIF